MDEEMNEKKLQIEGIRILRVREVCEKIGLSKPSIYRLMKENKFPKSIKIGRAAVGWRSDVVEEFILSRPQSTGFTN